MVTYIALLRGINVGGNNILPMADLRNIAAKCGLKNARTYIQSGNLVFETDETNEKTISNTLSKAIEKQFNFKIQILTLLKRHVETVLNQSPFSPIEPKHLNMWFLSEIPNAPDALAIMDLKAESEEYNITDKCFYLHAPKGIGRSKLAAKIEKILGVPTTARNLNSVQKILALAAN